MRADKLPNGDLRLSVDDDERAELHEHCAAGYWHAEALVADLLRDPHGIERVRPEWIGALTDAPIFSDGVDFADDASAVLYDDANVWWFPDYMIRDPWQELADDGEVTLTLAPSETR